jgi:MYXO-CTERM domain-containing protein
VQTSGTDLESVSFANANTLRFTAVPEPSAALLGALGALGLLRRRRI